MILGIDPGTTQSGWVQWDETRKRAVTSDVKPNDVVIRDLTDISFDRIGIEMIASYGMPVGREVFETCLWIGRFVQQLRSIGRQPRLIYRREVKMFLCGSMKAKDANVWQAIVDQYGPVGTKANPGPLYGVTSHARAALGVALTLDACRCGTNDPSRCPIHE